MLLKRDRLTSSTSWHAVGLLGTESLILVDRIRDAIDGGLVGTAVPIEAASVAVGSVNSGDPLLQALAALLPLRGTFGVNLGMASRTPITLLELLLIMVVYSGLGPCPTELERGCAGPLPHG